MDLSAPDTSSTRRACGRCQDDPARWRIRLFEANPGAPQEPPQRVVRHRHPMLAQFAEKRMQRQVRLLRQPTQQPVSLAVQLAAASAACRLGCRAARRTRSLRSLHDAGNAHPEQRRYLTSRLAIADCRYHTLSQIHRIGSCYPCRPPPSQQFESHPAQFGNPFRFNPSRKDSRSPTH